MAVATIEGVVEGGQIRLRDPVELPEQTTVYVVVPGVSAAPAARIPSPRLANPKQAEEFAKEIVEDPTDAEL